jgi:hypothetical protein
MIGKDDVGVQKIDNVVAAEPQKSQSDGGKKHGMAKLPERNEPQNKILPGSNSVGGFRHGYLFDAGRWH